MAVIGAECLWDPTFEDTTMRWVTRRHEDAKTPDEYLNALPQKRTARDENAFDPRKRSSSSSTPTRKIRNDFSSLTRISSRGALMPPRYFNATFENNFVPRSYRVNLIWNFWNSMQKNMEISSIISLFRSYLYKTIV